MPFANSILGGAMTLIRQAIRSPNYVAGLTGWTINKDGSAEFNNVTVRGSLINGLLLVYAGVPGAGTLLFSVAPNNAQDQYGNWYSAGAQFHSPGAAYQGVLFKVDDTAQFPIYDARIWIDNNRNMFIQGPNNFQIIELGATGSVSLSAAPAGGIFIDTASSKGLLVGSGRTGRYYFEEVLMSAQSIPNAVSTVVTGLTASPNPNDLQSDTGSAWNLATGIWTAPDDGIYDFDIGDVYAAWVNGSDTGIGLQRNSPQAPFGGTFQYIRYTEANSNGGAGSCTLRTMSEFVAGDTARVILVQRTGVAQNVAVNALRSTIRVRRTM